MASGAGQRFDVAGGMNTVTPPDVLQPGSYPFLQNVRRYLQGRLIARAPLGANVLPSALANGPTSLLRLNDPTADGPPAGFVLLEGTGAGTLFLNSTLLKSSLSGLPLSFITFRPNASPQPWAYIGDSAGMWKVRSDGTIWKVGIAEPQTAAGVTFVGGGSGTSMIFYRYVFRSSVTGALSNPSPESIAGTNAQANPTQSLVAATAGVINPNITVNATQYVGNGTQIRTAGGVAPGTVTDYIVARNFGFSVPTGVNIDGIQIDLNWVGQNSGTGTLTGVSLYHLGGQIGDLKFPGTPNQSFSTDTLQGGNGDTWGATLTSAIINDSTFGFGVQITTQSVGGSDRSFVNSMAITVFYSTQDANITPAPSTDPQVDKIDFYRQGGGLDNFTYVGTGPNSATVFNDQLTDLGAANNPLLQFDNFEPFPGIDLPKAGTVNVVAGGVAGTMTVTWVSGSQFNTTWLPGTEIIIGGVAYVFYNRPQSVTALTVILPTGSVVPSPGTGLAYEIQEPDLAAVPSPVIWGPTPDNGGSFYFGLDPINQGDLLWSKGNNFDSAPQTNRLAVTSGSETLMNGVVTSELSTVFSTERFWLIYPNFGDALADVTGTIGQQWTLIQSAATRGLYMRYAIDGLGAMIAWRAKDAICISMGGGPEQSISEAIYNLFPHEGFAPVAITIGGFTVFPPDDTKPNAQTVKIAPGYIFYNYQDTNGNPRTLTYDIEAKGWSVDLYTPVVNCHLWAVGRVDQLLTGCVDGTVRQLTASGTETQTAVVLTRSESGGSSRVVKRLGGWFVRAKANSAFALAFYVQRFQTAITGFAPSTITGASGVEQDFLVDFTAATHTDALDAGMAASWPITSGNYLTEYQIDWTTLPEQIIGYRTAMLSYGINGWMTAPWINLAYVSTAAVTLTLTLDFGAPIVLAFPSTGGTQQKLFQMIATNKFQLAGWTASSVAPFTIYAKDCELMVVEWGGKGQIVRPFEGWGTPGAST